MRAGVREVRDLVDRLTWCLGVPDGYRSDATSIVVRSQLHEGTGLAALHSALRVKDEGPPGEPSLQVEDTIRVDAAGHSLLWAGPMILEPMNERLDVEGSVQVQIDNVSAVGLTAGLEDLLTSRDIAVTLTHDPEAATVSGSARRGNSLRPLGRESALVTGMDVDEALWRSLFDRSLDVLLDVERIPDPEDARL